MQNPAKQGPGIFRLVSHMLAAVFNSRAAFYREWNGYQRPLEGDAIAGRWTGEWISDQSGHRGQLKCVLSPLPSGSYRAHFYASFSKLFSVGYKTELKVERRGDRVLLKGEEDLGALAGGVYRCEGEVSGADFTCQYSCKYDHGTFRLQSEAPPGLNPPHPALSPRRG